MSISLDVRPGHIVDLPASRGLRGQRHEFEETTIWAVNAALAAGRPLLIRGEPGAGKSQLARAVAAHLGWPFLQFVVASGCEPHDLKWRFDAVARLAVAQVVGSLGVSSDTDTVEKLDERRFLSPGVLWWAFHWDSAQAHLGQWHTPQEGQTMSLFGVPDRPEGWQPGPDSSCVLLVDEIDKADSDVPNGLLEALGDGRFDVPYIGDTVSLARNVHPPLVVITTNEERDLPPAFLRRCLVLQLGLSRDDHELRDWLVARGRVHFDGLCVGAILERAAELLIEDRKAALAQALPPPGQAEYLDLLRAIVELKPTDPQHVELDRDAWHQTVLDAVAQFALKKNPTSE